MGPITYILTTVLVLFTIPFFLDVTRLPDSTAAQEYIFTTLTPCNGLRICNLCGEVLEMVDLMQRALVDPFTDELSLSGAEWDPHSLQSYLQCLREPLHRGCDTLIHKVKSQRVEYAKLILEQILDDATFQHKWGVLGEDYIVSSAMRLTSYIFEAQERALLGRPDPYKEESAAQAIVYQHSTLSMSGDPTMETVMSRVWFLRREPQPLHRDFCYPVCEGKLGVMAQLRLAAVRFYLRYSLKERLLQLLAGHRSTMICVELLMVGLVACMERVYPTEGPLGDPGVSGALPNGKRTSSGTGAEGGGGGGGVPHGGAGGGTSAGSGKSHTRPGRRR